MNKEKYLFIFLSLSLIILWSTTLPQTLRADLAGNAIGGYRFAESDYVIEVKEDGILIKEGIVPVGKYYKNEYIIEFSYGRFSIIEARKEANNLFLDIKNTEALGSGHNEIISKGDLFNIYEILEDVICTPDSMIGDVNGDESITPGDAQLIFEISTGEASISENMCCADTNEDGIINYTDSENAFDYYLSRYEGNLIGKHCRDKLISLVITTTDEEYSVGEKIELTSSIRTRSYFEEISPDKQEISLPESKGYIVEFHDDSIIVKKLKLEKQKVNVARAIKRYGTALELTQSKQINYILNKLEKPKSIVKARYKNVFNGVLLDINEYEAGKVKHLKGVKGVYPNYETKELLLDSTAIINADDVWELNQELNPCTGEDCLTGKGTTIAIIDSGVDYTRPELGGCFGEGCKVAGGYDILDGDPNPMPSGSSHGTNCAMVAASAGEIKGVAPDAALYAYRVGSGGQTMLALDKIVDPNNDHDLSDHLDVVSISLIIPSNPDGPINVAIDNAVDLGIVVAIAAGNSGPDEGTLSNCARKALIVGASTKDDTIAGFSSRGPKEWITSYGWTASINKPDILAPGTNIIVAPGGSPISGTSFSTPHVAGAAALLKQKNPGWTAQEIKLALMNTAVDFGLGPNDQGTGRLDILSAINSDKPEIPLTAEVSINGIVTGAEYIDIIGTALGSRFERYTLSYLRDSEWHEITTSTTPVDFETLGQIDVTGLVSNEEIVIRLVVEGDGDVVSAENTITLGNARISSPYDLGLFDIDAGRRGKVVYGVNEGINIRGTANKGEGTEPYTFKLCRLGTEDCKTDVVSSYMGGRYPVINSMIGYINPNHLETGFYELTLTVPMTSEHNDSHTIYFYIDREIEPGWPNFVPTVFHGSDRGPYAKFLNHPNLADIDNDGSEELITSYFDSLRLISQSRSRSIALTDYAQFGSAISDIDGDGNGYIAVIDLNSRIHLIDKDGNPIIESIHFDQISGTPTLADLNNDGSLDILFSSRSGEIYAMDMDGNLIEAWNPLTLAPAEGCSDHLYETPASFSAGDINRDGNIEIFASITTCDGDKSQVWLLNNEAEILEGWPKLISNSVSTESVLIDIDSDSDIEIVFPGLSAVYAWNLDSSDVPGWPIDTGSFDIMKPYLSAGDINNDNIPEILLNKKLTDNTCLFAYGLSGNILDGFPICSNDPNLSSSMYGMPSIANLDSDHENEIILPVTGESQKNNNLFELNAFNNDGTVADGFPKLIDGAVLSDTVPVLDFDGDGYNEMYVSTFNGYGYLYDTEGTASEGTWKMFQYDSMNSGCYECSIEPAEKPGSKIINRDTENIAGELRIYIERLEAGTWNEYVVVLEDYHLEVLAESSLEYGYLFNQMDVTIDEPGAYRIIAYFDYGRSALQEESGFIVT